MGKTFPLLQLPLELREQIYAHYFDPTTHLDTGGCDGGGRYDFDFALYRASKQIYLEAQTMFRRENVFVRIETPWPTAVLVQHISLEGGVPIVASSHRAELFRHHHATISISSPRHGAIPEHIIILHLNDLPLFTQVWYYSSLSFPELNAQLCTGFALRDPYYPADPKPIPVALQRRILEGFDRVKGLYDTEFDGFDERLVEELRGRMAVPHPSVRECCEKSTDLMIEGDRTLTEGKVEEALRLYVKSFHAIHIIIEGRTRSVLADSFFHEGIESGRYSGQTGTTVRIILRIRLVARTIAAYLKLQDWTEAAFWGMRSIRIMREAMDTEFEDFISEFVGSADVGLIYLRTAIAFKKIEEAQEKQQDERVRDEMLEYASTDFASSERLFGLAAKYLKKQEQKGIRKEIEAYGVRVPEGLFGTGDDRSEVDSLAHLNLGQAENEADERAA